MVKFFTKGTRPRIGGLYCLVHSVTDRKAWLRYFELTQRWEVGKDHFMKTKQIEDLGWVLTNMRTAEGDYFPDHFFSFNETQPTRDVLYVRKRHANIS